ncbi:hypothetical protein HS088_TW22G01441 [Tripterygium wilfordii]|uniref:Uncharacterized protein n=1 Tax=Tripterygium wilfordii TaxID=458696 RepID=A0A7J7C0S8_TRIWF|nr:transcription factor MYB62-like [Tripterygium wilfordii]KAF5727744.1 hypothetical protein HS088_TW22G01441 [Tripterygium wilfordii]
MRVTTRPSGTKRICNSREEESHELRRGPWTLEEDTMLTHYIARQGEGRWNMLAKCAGLKRTGKSCRLRWLNYLKPDIKHGNLTPQEQLLILDLHSKWGNRWSKIAEHLPGRTDNEIKNYWRTRVQKQARQMNIESNSKRFSDALRFFWVPRLLQKMEQTSTSSSSSLTTQNQMDVSLSPNSTTAPTPTPPCPTPATKLVKNPNLISTENLMPAVTSPNTTISTDSITIISQQPQIPEYPKSPLSLSNDYSVYSNNPNLDDHCYYVSSSSFDMECFNVEYPISSHMGSFYNLPPECQVAEGNWTSNDMTDTLWNNLDDIWQLRDIEEVGI